MLSKNCMISVSEKFANNLHCCKVLICLLSNMSEVILITVHYFIDTFMNNNERTDTLLYMSASISPPRGIQKSRAPRRVPCLDIMPYAYTSSEYTGFTHNDQECKANDQRQETDDNTCLGHILLIDQTCRVSDSIWRS